MKQIFFIEIIHLEYILELKHSYICFTVPVSTIHMDTVLLRSVLHIFQTDTGKQGFSKCVFLITEVTKILLKCGRDGGKLLILSLHILI